MKKTWLGMAQKSAKPFRSASLRSVGPIRRTVGNAGVSLAPAITGKFAIAVPPWNTRVQVAAALSDAVRSYQSREAATYHRGLYACDWSLSLFRVRPRLGRPLHLARFVGQA